MNEDKLRRTIRDAMSRLVEGNPLRSDGKLTVKSLAEEAGVKRWVLTHKHTDLQDEFRAIADGIGREPEAVRNLREKLAERDLLVSRLRGEIKGLRNDRDQLERVINVLALESQQSFRRDGGLSLLGSLEMSGRGKNPA